MIRGDAIRVLLPTIRHFVDHLNFGFQGVRDLEGVRLTSWFRDERLNESVGGDPESQHLVALAVDLIVPRNPVQFISQMEKQGLHVVDEGSYIHVQAFPAGTLRRLGFFF